MGIRTLDELARIECKKNLAMAACLVYCIFCMCNPSELEITKRVHIVPFQELEEISVEDRQQQLEEQMADLRNVSTNLDRAKARLEGWGLVPFIAVWLAPSVLAAFCEV